MTGPNASWTWFDGRVLPADSVRTRADDQGVLGGLGVYETTRAVGTEALALTRHLARLHGAADRLGIELPAEDETIREACGAVIERVLQSRPGAELIRVRITLTAGPANPERGQGPGLLVNATPGTAWNATARAVSVPWTVNEHSPLTGIKCTSRAHQTLALRDAHRIDWGADEAIMCNTAGMLCEGSASNIFLEVDGRLCTPSLATGCLPGVTRDLLLGCIDVSERDDLTLDDLRRSREIFLTSGTRDVHPLAALDGVAPADVPGPLTTAAAAAYSALVASNPDP